MIQVKCIDPCLNVSPRTKGVKLDLFPQVDVGVLYIVTEIVKKYDREYYRLHGYPDNHIFDSRGFVVIT